MAIYRYSIITAAHDTYRGPSAIYRETTLTCVIRGSHHVVSNFCIWRVFRIRSRNIISVGVVCVKCLLKWTFKWAFLHLQWLTLVKSYSIEKMFLTFKLPLWQSSQTFYCLVIFYLASSSPNSKNLKSNIVYCLLFTILSFILSNSSQRLRHALQL